MMEWTRKIDPMHICLFCISQELSLQISDYRQNLHTIVLVNQHCNTALQRIHHTYLFVAGAFQDMHNPMMNKARPCKNAVDGSSGKTKSKTAAVGITEAALKLLRQH